MIFTGNQFLLMDGLRFFYLLVFVKIRDTDRTHLLIKTKVSLSEISITNNFRDFGKYL